MLGKRYENDGIPIVPLNNLQLQIKDRIALKIQQEIYKFELVPCCICENYDFELLSNKDRYGLYNPTVICKNCGLIQNNPHMNEQSYIDFYKSDHRKLFFGEKLPTEDVFRTEYKRGEEIFWFLKESGIINESIKDFNIFEVGCGSGGILQFFKENGFEVQGCDLDEQYLDYGKKKYNLNLHFGTLKEIKFEKLPNIIIYSHVLEHILNPKEELTQIKKILKKDGYLYIEVPGVKNLVKTYDMNFLLFLINAHVYYFSLTTLTNLLSSNGFKLIKGNNVIRSIFQVSEISQFKYKNDYFSTIKYLHTLEKSRRLLLFLKVRKLMFQFIKSSLQNYRGLKHLRRTILNLIKGLFQRYIAQIRLFKKLIYVISEKI